MSGASGNVKVITGGVVFIAILAVFVYLDRTNSPNAGSVMFWLTNIVAALLAYTKSSAAKTGVEELKAVQGEIHEKVNGSFDRAQRTAAAALSALPADRADEVLRRVQRETPTDDGVR